MNKINVRKLLNTTIAQFTHTGARNKSYTSNMTWMDMDEVAPFSFGVKSTVN